MKTLLKIIKNRMTAYSKKLNVKLQFTREWALVGLGCYKKVEISVADLILKNSKGGELLRSDIIVRYLGVGEYFGKNKYGFDLYKKMQNIRVKAGYGEDALEQYKELIQSYDKNGYDKESFILVDRDLNLIDGSHRMALALYFGIPNITAYIVNSEHPVEYSMDWFYINGFSAEETELLSMKSKEMFREAAKAFSCIIWAPGVPYIDEIVRDLSYYGTVTNVVKRRYKLEEYNNIVKAIYAIDDIENWKIEKKIEHMKGHAPELVSLDILFTDPEFRIKKATNLPLSRRGERVKKTIRSKYKQRVPNYFFDIIMHIGDNVYQSRYMQQVLEPQISFSEVLDILENYIYVLAKVNTPYMPDSFPDDIPVGKDVDVLCNKENIEDISNKLESHFITSTDYEVERKRNNHGIQVRISCCKKLIFLIDLAWSVEGLKKTFVEAALGERVMKGSYYELSPRHEYIYRLISFHEDKSKLHHREYLEKNKGNFDREELTRYYCSNIDRLLY